MDTLADRIAPKSEIGGQSTFANGAKVIRPRFPALRRASDNKRFPARLSVPVHPPRCNIFPQKHPH